MNKYGIVTKCDKEFAFVRITRDSMCGDNCGNCNLCANKEIEIKAINEAGASAGDRGEMKMPEKTGFSAAFLVYGAPMLILLLGIIIGAIIKAEELSVIVSVVLIALWYVVLMIMEKNKKYSEKLTPIIVSVVGEKNV